MRPIYRNTERLRTLIKNIKIDAQQIDKVCSNKYSQHLDHDMGYDLPQHAFDLVRNKILDHLCDNKLEL